jgi:stage V sporulation protein S
MPVEFDRPFNSEIRVAANSDPSAVAGAIASVLRRQPTVYVQAMGAYAVYNAIKATIIARSYLEGDQLDVLLCPDFVPLNGERPFNNSSATLIATRMHLQTIARTQNHALLS